MKQVADVLRNEDRLSGEQVRERFVAVVARMEETAVDAKQAGQENLTEALEHFVKVSSSYEPGLFHCYDVMDLERTNNDLEHVFGKMRHHERRVSGRKQGSPNLVLRGAVRLVAMLATKTEEITPEELAPRDPEQWRKRRAELRRRRQSRARQTRFRRDPDGYLRQLEDLLDQPGLLA